MDKKERPNQPQKTIAKFKLFTLFLWQSACVTGITLLAEFPKMIGVNDNPANWDPERLTLKKLEEFVRTMKNDKSLKLICT